MPYKTVSAVRDLGVNRGATSPRTMQCSDGKTYVVKFADETRSAVNEYLGYTLSQYLALPVPASALVRLSADLIAGSDDLRNREIIPGIHHGSEVVADALNFEELSKRKAGNEFEVLNYAEIPGIVCLDNWIMTRDRQRNDNHLLQPAEGKFRYFTIDFSCSFTGPDWTKEMLENAAGVLEPAPISPIIASTIAGLASVEPVLSRIESITDSEISSMVVSVPPVWGLTEEEQNALVSFLRTRRQLVRPVVASYLAPANRRV